MADHDKHNETKEEKNDGQEENVAAVVPFLFLNEAGAYIEDILRVLREERPDAILHDFAGIAGTMAADILGDSQCNVVYQLSFQWKLFGGSVF